MSEAKHTPGPWAQQLQSNGVTVRHVQISADSGDVATAVWKGGEHETNANARLISAAPEMLEALQLLLNDNHPEQIPFKLWQKVRAAIEKATGRPQ